MRDDRIPGSAGRISQEQLEENAQQFIDGLPPLAEVCPDCDASGTYDGRVLVGGRGIYTCSRCGCRWQDTNESPSSKAAVALEQKETP